jgi:hypothetical protein
MSTVAFGATIEQQSAPPPAAVPTHTQVRQQFAPYLAQELAPAEQAGVAAYLRHCPACATALVTLLQGLRATIELLGSLPRHPAPPALRQRLLAILDREAAGGKKESDECGECLRGLLPAGGGSAG